MDSLCRYSPGTVFRQGNRCEGWFYRGNNWQYAFRHGHPHEPGAGTQGGPAGQRRRSAHSDAAGNNTDLAVIALMAVNRSRLQFRYVTDYLHFA